MTAAQNDRSRPGRGGSESVGDATATVAPTRDSDHVPARLTRAERTDLQRVARMRARVSRTAIEARKAELLHDFELQLDATYAATAEQWADLMSTAQAAVTAADDELARRCAEFGIDPRFRPRITASWHGRGENATKDRRAELRRLATAELDAAAKAAKHAIDAAEADTCGLILADGLGSVAAREHLDAIPSPRTLMGSLDLSAIEGRAPAKPERFLDLG